MDWTILINACASALGGVATALVVIGFFGNKLFGFWFDKALARYETNLDDKAAKSKAKFEQAHPERAKVVLEVYTICVEVGQLLQTFQVYRGIARHDKGHALTELMKIKDEITTKLILVEDHTQKRIYFPADLREFLEAYKQNAMNVFEDTTDGNLENCLETSKRLMAGIETEVQTILGLVE